MFGLLAEVSSREYPTEYLLARLGARSEALVAADGEAGSGRRHPAGSDDSRIWQKLREEQCWLYRQLNTILRRALAPLFAYFEISTVAQVLRFQAAGYFDTAAAVLETSMLARDLQAILRGREGVTGVLARLEQYFRRHGAVIKGLGSDSRREDLRRSEELLRSGILAAGLRRSSHGTMTSFLVDLADMRNLLILARALRWKTATLPEPFPGGRLKPRFSGVPPAAEELMQLVRHWLGRDDLRPEQLHPAALEEVLQSHLLRKAARLRRLGDPVAACIEYLWQLFIITRQRSMQFHAGREDGGTVPGKEGA